MTLIGEAELDIRAVGDHFAADVTRTVQPGMNKAGAAAEQAAARGKKAFSMMWGSFNTASLGAMGPVMQMVGSVQAVGDELLSKSRALQLTAAGAAGIGVGAGLQAFASREQAAAAQLQASYASLGHDSSEYGKQISDTVKHGEHFGVQAYETIDALNRLTIATKNPKKAFADYQVVLDMAAARHIGVVSAAQMLASAYAGNTRVFRSFGISVADNNKLLKAAETADHDAATAAAELKKAKQNLSDEEARIAGSRKGHAATAAQLASAEARVTAARSAAEIASFKHGSASPQNAAAQARLAAAEANLAKVRQQGSGTTTLTVSQEIALRKAHDAVTAASAKARAATEEKTKADKAAKGATTDVDSIIKQLSQRLDGQASAAADNFAGNMRALGAEIEDRVAQFGGQWGPAITTASTGLLGIGTVMTVTQGVMGHFRGSVATTAAAEESLGTSAAKGAGVAGTELSNLSSSGGMSMGKLVGAIAGVTAAIGVTAVVAGATAHGGAGGAAAATLTGAVSGAVVGLSVAGPFGAAVGGAIGALTGLAFHFHDAAHEANGTTTAVKNLAAELETGLSSDKLNIGASTKSVISSFLTSNPAAAKTLAKYGISMADLTAYLTSGGVNGPPGALNAASRPGLGTNGKGEPLPAGVQQALDILKLLLQAYQQALATAAAIGQINAPPKPRGHKAAGGRVDPFGLYQVGEQGPEWLQMGATAGYVHPNGTTPRGWDDNLTQILMALAGNQSATNARLAQILEQLRDHPAQIAGKLHSGSAVQQRFMQPELQ